MNNFYVYCFINIDWDSVFYVGKGSGERYKDFEKRNDHIKAILEHHRCVSQVLFDNLTEEEAIAIETELKEYYKSIGCPIIDYEKNSYSKKQRYGIEQAKQEGKYVGRKHIEIDNFDEYYEMLSNGLITKIRLAELLNISRPTLDRIVKDKVNK